MQATLMPGEVDALGPSHSGRRVSRAPCHALACRLTGDVQVQVLRLVQAMQFLRRGAAALLHSQRGRRAAPRAGGRGGPVRPPLVLSLHGVSRGPSGGHNHGPARPLAGRSPRQPRARALRAASAERPCGDGGRRRSPAAGGRAGAEGGAGPTAPALLPPAAAAGPEPQPWLQRLLPLPAPPSPLPGARSPLVRPRRPCCRGRLGLPPVTAHAHRGRGRCWGGAREQRAAAPGDPRRAVPWSFIHKKGPTTLLGARRLRPIIGQ